MMKACPYKMYISLPTNKPTMQNYLFIGMLLAKEFLNLLWTVSDIYMKQLTTYEVFAILLAFSYFRCHFCFILTNFCETGSLSEYY